MFLGRHAEVAGAREVEPGADRGAVQHRDGRLRQVVHLLHQRVRVALPRRAGVGGRPVGIAVRGPVAHVGARAEPLPRARQHDGADRLVGGGGGERRPQRLEQREVERVAALGAIHGDRADAVGVGDEREVVGHGSRRYYTCGQRRTNGSAVGSSLVLTHTDFSRVYSRITSGLFSLPMPDCLNPPSGDIGDIAR